MCLVCSLTATFDPARHPDKANVFEIADAPETIGTPYTIAAGDTFVGTLDAGDYGDWVAVDMVAGTTYVFDLTGSGTNPIQDPFLQLYDGAGNYLTFDDNGGAGVDAQLVFTASATGTYFISAEEYSFSTGTYSLTMTASGGGASTITEDVDAPYSGQSTPYTINPGETFDGTMTSGDQGDMLFITLTAGQSYTFTLDGTGADPIDDPWVFLRDASGVFLDGNFDTGPGDTVTFDYTATYTGTHQLVAADWNLDTGAYRLVVDIAGGGVTPPPTGGLDEVADAPSHTATPYSMNVGDTFTGEIGNGDDADWIAITLTQGQWYDIALTGSPSGDGTLDDPLVRIFDSNGILLDLDDDGGTGLESLLTFEAGYSGTFYVAADAYGTDTGTYTLAVDQGSAPLPVSVPPAGTIDALADYLTNGYWTDNGRSPREWDTGSSNVISVNITGLTADGRQLARWAFEAWETVADLVFVETTGVADITFDDFDSGAYADVFTSGGFIRDAFVNVSNGWLLNEGASIDSYSLQVYIHEVGHALGLGHQGSYNGNALFPTDATFGNDSWQLSVMSYFSQIENTTVDATYGFVISAMMADIVAIQGLYGAPDAASSPTAGDTVWGAGSTLGTYLDGIATGAGFAGNPFALTIYDVGGTDTLDLSVFDEDARIDLRAERFSDVGGYVGNVGIARGTVIENLMTGIGADTITGNAAANRIEAGAGDDFVTGGDGDDTILGQDGHDEIYAGLGHDSVFAGDGDDIVGGGAGNDTLDSGAGNDTIFGGAGDDVLITAAGTNEIWTNSGSDTVIGGTGADMVGGAAGDDSLTGGGGADSLYGSDGNDTLLGQDGNDDLWGGDGFDLLDGGPGADTLGGGAGDDTLLGGDGFDTIYGGDGADVIEGGAQADEIWSGLGDDTVAGDGGNDLIGAGAGADSLLGGAGADTVYGGSGNDHLDGGDEADALWGMDDNDTLLGGGGNDTLGGGAGNDSIDGGAGDDLVFAGTGDDTLTGGAGNDTLFGAGGADVIVFNDGDEADRVGGFSTAEDRLQLDAALWGGTPLTATQVVATFGSDNGSDFVLDFLDGDVLTLAGQAGIGATLGSLIDIV